MLNLIKNALYFVALSSAFGFTQLLQNKPHGRITENPDELGYFWEVL